MKIERKSKPRVAAATFVAALVLGAGGSFAIAQVAAGDDASSAGPATAENVEGFDAADVRRQAMTKILAGMKYTGAPESDRAPFEAELEALGGIDPSVPALDGPDSDWEWAVQAVAYEEMCAGGDQDACAALPDAEERAGNELETINENGAGR